MYPHAHISDPSNELARPIAGKPRSPLFRKVWLPKSLYTALPFLYIGLGLYATGSALLLGHWSWIAPYIIIFGIILLHGGTIIMAKRWRNRNSLSGPRGTRRN
ncbi:MAG: hypothetical protein QF790_00430 [Gammaproteobacteria bacterium]|nr:hypothetical protein [Gammaproteobacteria bacterium]MDP6615620.1 hypothetical protein [Gammaproteobacteria bacterium]MDP6695867.1 hypothetical protein [Gammaproteobacteria bacterium]